MKVDSIKFEITLKLKLTFNLFAVSDQNFITIMFTNMVNNALIDDNTKFARLNLKCSSIKFSLQVFFFKEHV